MFGPRITLIDRISMSRSLVVSLNLSMQYNVVSFVRPYFIFETNYHLCIRKNGSMEPRGILIAIGGNEDKGFDTDESRSLDFIEEGILSHVVAKAGGENSRILLITTASGIPEKVYENYREAFDKLGCRDIVHHNIRSNEEANDSLAIREIEEADAVMFSGGDQRKLNKVFTGSSSLQLLKERYLHEKFVIVGTSAGAVAMSRIMVSGGSSANAMLKGAVKMMPGLDFITDVIFDSHFIRRGRFGRLTEAVALHPTLMGIGLGEDTGLIIYKGNEFQTIGSGMIILFDGRGLTHNSVDKLNEGTPISIGNMTIHVLANNDWFFLKEKKFRFLPIEEHFI